VHAASCKFGAAPREPSKSALLVLAAKTSAVYWQRNASRGAQKHAFTSVNPLVRDTGIESVYAGESDGRLVPIISLLGQHAVHRCSTHPKRARDGARGLPTRVHPPRQRGF
jgi:hypothetical protein